jgi:solute carrier family 25 protein 33/36
MREQARAGLFKYKGMWQTLRVIAKEEGRVGLYSGMGIHLLKVVPNSALMFLTYELVNSWLGEFTVVDKGNREEVNASGSAVSNKNSNKK